MTVYYNLITAANYSLTITASEDMG